MKNKQLIALVCIAILLVVFDISGCLGKNKQTETAIQPELNKTDLFAVCLTEKGAAMYGSYRCPHCNNQKALFGGSVKYINYIECANPPEVEGQRLVCNKAEVQAYPTWTFANGQKIEGELSLEQLSKITGCPLP